VHRFGCRMRVPPKFGVRVALYRAPRVSRWSAVAAYAARPAQANVETAPRWEAPLRPTVLENRRDSDCVWRGRLFEIVRMSSERLISTVGNAESPLKRIMEAMR
jgi:hypothetical protein